MTSPSDLPRNVGKARIAVETEDVSAQTDEVPTAERDILPIRGTDQPTSTSENDGADNNSIKELLRDILEAVQDSSIAGPTAAKDNRSRFWGKYKRVAEEHDLEFLERYSSDMDIVLIFAGLFSAVSTSFIVAMEPTLLPDPSDTTNALLLQIAQTLGNVTMPGYIPMAPVLPVFSGPMRTDVWVQTIAYLSLASSLLAAFGAVLGKQWLGYYKSSRYGRGSLEERGIRRQEKFQGLQTWHLDAILQSFPLLIQASLLLFGLALSGHMWSEQRTIASVIIATTAFGVLFYLFTLFASLLSPTCPFQSPLSTICRMLWLHIAEQSQFYRWTAQQALSSKESLREKLDALNSAIHHLFRRLSHLCSTTNDIENGSIYDVSVVDFYGLPDIPLKGGAASSVLWLIETSTDPEVLLAASRMVPEVDWHPELDISAAITQLYGMLDRSLTSLRAEEHDNAIMYCRSLLYLRLEEDEDNPEQLIRYTHKLGKKDDFINIIQTIFSSETEQHETVPKFLTAASDRPQDILQVLHLLPYANFRFAGGDQYLQSSLRSLVFGILPRIFGQNELTPSTPGISDCAMVIGRLLGCQFHVKDKRKVDKSEACDQIMILAISREFDRNFEWYQEGFPSVLDGHTTGHDVKAHILIDCLPFIFKLQDIIGQNLIILQARMPEYHERNDFDHCPWFVKYLEYLCANDVSNLQNSLLVSMYGLSDLKNSPAGSRSYLKTITFCMSTDKPHELRYTALRAIYAQRDILYSPVEHSTSEWDAVLATFSATLFKIVHTTSNKEKDHRDSDDDGDGQSVRDTGDLDDRLYFYLRLIDALAQVDTWHERLIRDGHIQASITLPTPQRIQASPLLVCLRALITLRILKSLNNPTATHTLLDVEENALKSIATDFWTTLTSTKYLVDIFVHEQFSKFLELLPDILSSSRHTTSVDVVGSIMGNIPDVRVGMLAGRHDPEVFGKIMDFAYLSDLRGILEHHQLNRPGPWSFEFVLAGTVPKPSVESF